MHLTPAILEAQYELLRVCPPFRRWRMPPGDEVEFHVITSSSWAGDYEFRKGVHLIRVNGKWCGTLLNLQRVVAHEMVHLHLQIAFPRDQSHHGARFKAKAALVCKHLCLDPLAF